MITENEKSKYLKQANELEIANVKFTGIGTERFKDGDMDYYIAECSICGREFIRSIEGQLKSRLGCFPCRQDELRKIRKEATKRSKSVAKKG